MEAQLSISLLMLIPMKFSATERIKKRKSVNISGREHH